MPTHGERGDEVERTRERAQGERATEPARTSARASARDGLIARIRHLRSVARAVDEAALRPPTNPEHDELDALEARVRHVEQLLQGLQDSVHRESTRISNRVAELEARVEPAALGRALSEDARNRGL